MPSALTRVALAVFLILAAAGCRERSAPQTSDSGFRVDVINGERRYTNRLITEKSPYLQLHAHNPVNWYAWGAEAFDKARREGKPIFLSVGYSTCHWCHVMEAESFSNPAIADFMNGHFISIKVDREERPDLDRLYMNYVIGVSEGGWPMSLFLTPDLKPFFGANYLPPDDRDGNPGFRTILQKVATLWETKRAEALQAAADGTQALEQRSRATTGRGDLTNAAALFDAAYDDISKTFDPASAGFGGAPRFPRPVVLNFLIRQYARTGNRAALEMTLATLRAMAAGGLRDQLGGGFHRYATDRLWRVPHFEKMLYDQAQLTVAYVEAYQASHDTFFRDVALETLRYVRRDMSDAEGGFYSAEDADSQANADTAKPTEGAYYVWTDEEFRRTIGAEADLVGYYYGVETGGNVPRAQDTQRELSGRNVLYVAHTLADTAARFDRTEAEVRAVLDISRRRLLTVRANRPRPPRDDKVLVAWNGLMLSALSRAAQAFEDDESRAAAVKLAGFLKTRMFDATAGTLKRRYRHGDADIDGLLEDYAFLIQGLLDLYEAAFDPSLLEWASRLQETQDRLFWDERDGGYFSTRSDAANVLTRAKEEYDGAEPAANSVAAMNLLRLWQLTDRELWRQRADGTFRALSPRLTRSGGALPQMLAALGYARSRPRQIVIAGDRDAGDTRALLRLVHDRFMPNRILLVADGGPAQAQLTPLVPFLEGMTRRDGRATIYVCENYACRLPTSDPIVAARLLDGKR